MLTWPPFGRLETIHDSFDAGQTTAIYILNIQSAHVLNQSDWLMQLQFFLYHLNYPKNLRNPYITIWDMENNFQEKGRNKTYI